VARLAQFSLDMQRKLEQADLWIAELALRQHGVVSRTQLYEMGLGAGAIEHRIACGRLHVIHRGV
jgi:hypothetical protein